MNINKIIKVKFLKPNESVLTNGEVLTEVDIEFDDILVFKLMSSGNFDVIKLSKDFDSCETENDIESLYQQYITSEEQK